MNRTYNISFPILACCALLFGCSAGSEEPAGRDGWLKGTKQEKLETIATQFRGFDMVMVETGYRYQELYWAGQDMNWEYADYQADKIKQAIETGLVRRPKRAKNSNQFLSTAIPDIKKAIEARDTAVFNESFHLLTAKCNTCHVREKMPFFTVKPPLVRQSSIQYTAHDQKTASD